MIAARRIAPGHEQHDARLGAAHCCLSKPSDWAAVIVFGSVFAFAAVSPFAISAIIIACNFR